MSSNRRNSRPRVEESRRKNTTRSAPQNPPQISAPTPPRPSTAPSTLVPLTSAPRAQPYPPTGRPTRRQATGRKSQDQEEEGEERTEAAPPGPRSASPASSRPRSASIGGEEGTGGARRRLLLCPLPTASGVLECIEEERREVETRKKMRGVFWGREGEGWVGGGNWKGRKVGDAAEPTKRKERDNRRGRGPDRWMRRIHGWRSVKPHPPSVRLCAALSQCVI